MTLDTQLQRELLMAAVTAASWPGKIVEEIVELKKAITEADIKKVITDQPI